ncbi:MAG: ornithine carbamoyltransferase [Chloroflexota bacterium]|nr:ornithine carbamoyltransferase [Chloroflexota bacterium]
MRHLLSVADLESQEVRRILELAEELRAEWREGGNRPLLAGKALGMIFQKPSLRTRVSFEVAMLQLGGWALYLSPGEVGLGERESVPDASRVLSRYVDGIMARVFTHADIGALAAYSSVPVINGLSDYNHPCQALADLLTIADKKGGFEGLKLAYVGDGNNVCTSLLFAATKVGMDIAVASPKAYAPTAEVVEKAQGFAAESNSQVTLTDDPSAAAQGADVLYTDVWVSMGQEEETEKRLRAFPPYQVNSALLAQAKDDAIVMHCLPAHRGQEITDEVVDSSQSVIFDQAENRLHAQKAVLALLLGELGGSD